MAPSNDADSDEYTDDDSDEDGAATRPSPRTAQDAPSPLEVLRDELQFNQAMAVVSISRLRVIGVALGPERTHSELLPYLCEEIQQGNLNDEVMLALTEVLSEFVEFVSSTEDAKQLLAPLRELACAEENFVRERAVAAVVTVGRALPAEIVGPQLIPMVLGLGTQEDWFTPRVSASAMLPLAVELSVGMRGGSYGLDGPPPVTASSSCVASSNASLAPTPPPPRRLASSPAVSSGAASSCGPSPTPPSPLLASIGGGGASVPK